MNEKTFKNRIHKVLFWWGLLTCIYLLLQLISQYWFMPIMHTSIIILLIILNDIWFFCIALSTYINNGRYKRSFLIAFTKLGFRSFQIRQSIILIGIFLLLNIFFGEIWQNIIFQILRVANNTTNLMHMYEHQPSILFAILIISILLPPIAEESLFRGLICNQLFNYVKPFWAILLSALLFGILHWDIAGFGGQFLAGIFLGCLYYKTHSIWPGIILHSLINLIATISILFFIFK